MSDTQPIDFSRLAEDAKDVTIAKQDDAIGCSLLNVAMAIDKLGTSLECLASARGMCKATLEASILMHAVCDGLDAAIGIRSDKSRPWVKVDSEEALRSIASILDVGVIENGTIMSAGIDGTINFTHRSNR